jgi:hypothetical protein
MNIISGFCFLSGLFIALWMVFWLRFAGKVKIYGKKNRALQFLKGDLNILYFPHFIYGLSARYNTVIAFIKNGTKFKGRKEKFFGKDGGQFFVDWYSSENDIISPDTPTVVLLHGISGGSKFIFLFFCIFSASHLFKSWVCILLKN